MPAGREGKEGGYEQGITMADDVMEMYFGANMRAMHDAARLKSHFHCE
jgi:hypothetical protein